MRNADVYERTFDKTVIEYIKNVFKLERMTAADIMTQQKSVVFISDDATESEIMSIIESEGYSRVLICPDNDDNMDRILYGMDHLPKNENSVFCIKQTVAEPLYVPENMKLGMLLKLMQKNHNYTAVTADEYGIPSGVVTMEDIIEKLVGEFWSGNNEGTDNIRKLNNGTYCVSCATPTEDFFNFFGLPPDEKSEAATVNGWLIEKCGNIPLKGYTFEYESISVTVTKADEIMTNEITVKNTEPVLGNV